MIKGVASILIYVSDMNQARDFYGRLLGSEPSEHDPTTAIYDLGNTSLILHIDRLPARAGVRGAMEFNLEVEDVQAFCQLVRERGIDAPEPKQTPWGWTLLSLEDPEGNEIEIYQISAAGGPA